MLHRLIAFVGYPAHLLNRQLAGPLGRLGLARVPGALLVGLALAGLAATTASATREAYEARPQALAVTISDIVEGRVGSGFWVEFDGLLIDGPHVATVEVFAGPQSQEVERIYYLFADPESPDQAVVVRAQQNVPALEGTGAAVALHGTITEDPFNLGNVMADWDPASRHPDIRVIDSRLIAYAFETPFVEPTFIGAILLGVLAAIALIGALLRQPILRRSAAGTGARGLTPITLGIHGELATPRGAVQLRGTPAQLEWMNVEEIARTRWRYWGAALGDVRGEVEAAVGPDGGSERLVLHGPTGSVIWPIEDVGRLEIEAGDAFIGARRMAALRVRGAGVAATLTFGDAGLRDAALAEIRAADDPS
ncbi:MAG TPA: hypothetical protein VEW95_06340 [Candidatus Limnocylindrales bacterium]|nr:hypothetical protein [Candidatus Limnocylindrales bacterium]